MGFQFPYDIRNAQNTAGFLTIDTDTMTIVFEGGCVVYVKDKTSNEELLDASSSSTMNTPTRGMGTRDDVGDERTYLPNNSSVSGSSTGDNSYQLTCTNLNIANASILYDFTINPATGSVDIQVTGIENNSGFWPSWLVVPIVNMTKTGRKAIVGPTSYAPADEAFTQISQKNLTWSPEVAILQGDDAVVALWDADFNLDRCVPGQDPSPKFNHYAQVTHDPDFDHITGVDQDIPGLIMLTSPTTMVSGLWRIGTFATWLDFAKQWRTEFIAKADGDLHYLWENPATWIRSVHCYYTGDYLYGDPDSYDAMEAVAPANKTLWLIMNQDVFVTENDYQGCTIFKPIEADLTAVNSRGFNIMMGQGWNFVYDLANLTQRLTNLEGRVPGGYEFTPQGLTGWDNDYSTFYDQFSSYLAHQANDGSQNYYPPKPAAYYKHVHPAVAAWQDFYIAHRAAMADYFDSFGTNKIFRGNYEDTLGGTYSVDFIADGVFTINGKHDLQASKDLMKAARTAYPDLIPMPEWAASWCVLYSPVMWEHYGLVLGNDPPLVVNHPLRGALLGSFQWYGNAWAISNTRNLSMDWGGHAAFAALPQYALVGTDSTPAQYVSKLFCTFDLFHELPDTWKTVGSYSTMAYYKSNTGNPFRMEVRGSYIFAWVEERDAGDYDRLVIDTGVVDTDNIDVEFSMFSKGSYTSLPATATDLTSIYTSNEVSQVTSNDEVYATQEGLSEYVIHQYKQIETTVDDIQANITCNLQSTIAPSQSNVVLEVYDTNSDAWVEVDREVSAAADTDFDLAFNLTSGSTPTFENAKDELGVITGRIWQHAE